MTEDGMSIRRASGWAWFIILTTESGKVLTKEALFAEAKATAGPECPISDLDLGIILPFAKFLKKLPGGGYVLR